MADPFKVINPLYTKYMEQEAGLEGPGRGGQAMMSGSNWFSSLEI